MIDLDMAYNKGLIISPSPGRYTVSIQIQGFWQVILEKIIGRNTKGQNHLPIFFMRRFNVPSMDFHVVMTNKEIMFIYENGLLVDKLRKQSGKNGWIGKIYWKGIFLDYFILRPK